MCGRIIQAGFGGMKIIVGRPIIPALRSLATTGRHRKTWSSSGAIPNEIDLLRWGLALPRR